MKRTLIHGLRGKFTVTAEVIRIAEINYITAVFSFITQRGTLNDFGSSENQAQFVKSKCYRETNLHSSKKCYYCKR